MKDKIGFWFFFPFNIMENKHWNRFFSLVMGRVYLCVLLPVINF